MPGQKKEDVTPTPDPEPEKKPAPIPEPPVAPLKEEIEPHPALTEFEAMVRKIMGEQNAHNDERFNALEARLPAAEKKENKDGVQKEEQKPAPVLEPEPKPKPKPRTKWKLWRSL